MTRIRYVGSNPSTPRKGATAKAGKPASVSRLIFALGALTVLGLCGIALMRCELSEIRVQGASLVDEGTVRAVLQPQLGNALVLIDTEALRGGLVEDPWVEDVEISRRLPGRMRVVVRAAQPCMRLEDGRSISSEGRLLPARDDVDLSSLPLLQIPQKQLEPLEESGVLAEFCSALSRAPWPFEDSLESIEIRGQDWILHDSADIRYAVGHDQFPRRLQRVAIARDRFAARKGDCVDVRFERQIVLVPAAAGSFGG